MGSIILSLPTVYDAVYDTLWCEVMCVVHVKYYNHLLAVDVAGVACRGLCMHVVRKMSKDIGMGVRKGTVVSFVSTLFGCFLGIPSLYVFSFFKMFFVTSFFFGWGGGDIKAIDS